MHAQPPADACTISGAVTSGRTALPGVALTLSDASGRVVGATSTADDGTFALRVRGEGELQLKAELVAFAPMARAITVAPDRCDQRADLAMTLASRAPAAAPTATPPVPSTTPDQQAAVPPDRPQGSRPQGSRPPGARGSGGRGGGGQFQSLRVLTDQNGAGNDDQQPDGGDASRLLLPPGFSADASTESVTSIGSAQASAPVGFGDRPDFFGGDGAGGPGNPAGPGGPGGPGGRGFGGGPGFGGGQGFGGGGGPGGGRGGFGRGVRGNQIRGSVFQSFDSSSLDAPPFSLNGLPTENPSYFQMRLGATVGGPLVIPGLISSPKTFFFVNYTGNHASNPTDIYSTVPTAAERGGDLSALGRTIVDPSTGKPFAGNQIPASRMDAASLSLLNLFPLPNEPGTKQNFHYQTTTGVNTDDINVRLVHTFGTPTPGQGRGRGGGGGGGRGFGGGGGGTSNLNVTIHYRHQDNEAATPFPSIGGSTKLSAWDIPVGYTFTTHGIANTLRVQYNWQQSTTANLYAGVQNVAGNAGVQGVSSDPFDWGAPSLSFSSFASLNDVTPSLRRNQTISVGDQMIKTRGRHTLRWGGDYRDIRADGRADPNASGTFVFTGLYSGADFADFLLGLPQQASVQFGAGLEQFRQKSWDVYVQDAWRARDTLTIDAGVRYEYVSPFTAVGNRLVDLDVPADFSAAVPVLAGQTGPYFGQYPNSIVTPDRNNVAPRVGIAWRPASSIVVRTGYGISYSTGVYQTIVQQLANQPPFARADTTLGTAAVPIALTTALLGTPTDITTNSYGVDPLFRAPFVQIWNLDLQRELARTWNVGIGYVGTKGGQLDLVRAPNRTASGLRIEGVDPFLWESSGADSIMNAVTFRLRKRLTHGIGGSVSYTLSRSIDDASSVGGGATVVAQNDLDLAAERGLSSFDQRHRVNADLTYELPFGPDRRWLNSGVGAAWLGGWVLNANAQFASGVPFTARVLSNEFDVSRGTNGTLRANYTGQPVDIADPTTREFFNVLACTVPPPGEFGNAGRNTIIGPGVENVNLGVTRNLTLGPSRVLSVQVMVSNLFNTAQYSAIDTIVNSPTFGQVTAARAPRRLQILTRFRF